MRDRLGFKAFPIMRAVGWTEDEKKAYAIWDNQSTKQTKWKEERRDETLIELQSANFDMGLTGFPDFRVIEQPDLEVKEIPTGRVADTFWISVQGQLGDQAGALQALQQVMRQFPGVKVELGTTPREVS